MRDDSTLTDSSNDAETILCITRERSSALVQKDVSTLDRILAPEFVYTNASGQVLDKTTYLARYVASPDVQWLSQELDDVQVQIFGDSVGCPLPVHLLLRQAVGGLAVCRGPHRAGSRVKDNHDFPEQPCAHFRAPNR